MELNKRRLTLEDYATIVKWWASWPDWEPLAQDLLPENGTGGIMIERNGIPVVAGFLYATNSKIAWMEWIVGNPEERGIEGGFKVILSIGRSKSLIDKHKKLGYKVDDNPSYEIIKKIN